MKHLLEDLRDSYTSPLEEVILTELVANALDSKATEIHFTIDLENRYLRCTDNGNGMKRPRLKNYHNIAASAKVRGSGIGFAGVGAKLSLLIAEKVVTESKGGYGTRAATEWRLTDDYRAPWKFIPFGGSIQSSRGTSVTIYFFDDQSSLLETDFTNDAIIKHFYPLLSEKFYQNILKYFYRKPVNFYVNGNKIILPEEGQEELQHWFYLTLGKNRRAIGAGFLVKTGIEPGWLQKILGQAGTTASLPAGLWISTFGKVIKGGWDWLGILPKNSDSLVGLVEIPALSEILTTNKNGFLTDTGSLKKYYKYRKAVQESVLPILKQLGEDRTAIPDSPEKILKPLSQTITGALNRLMDDFPELESLIGTYRKQAIGQTQKISREEKTRAINLPVGKMDKEIPAKNRATAKTVPPGVADKTKDKIVRVKNTQFKLLLADIPDAPEMPLGRIVEDTLTVNTIHPAWKKAKQKRQEEYHILITVASTLSQFLESEKSPQDFLNRLLIAWATEIEEDKRGKLF